MTSSTPTSFQEEKRSFNTEIDRCIREVKPLGLYQILLLITLQLFTIAFSLNTSLMTFGGLAPLVACGNQTSSGTDSCEVYKSCLQNSTQIQFGRPHGFMTIGNTWPDVFTDGCFQKMSPVMVLVMVSMGAFVIGGLASGPVSDYLGRRIPILFGGATGSVLGLAAAFAPNFPTFSVFHILSLFSYTLASYPAITLGFESTLSAYRIASFFAASWLIGFMMCGVVGMLTLSWNSYMMYVNIFGLATTLPYIFFGDSPRWCITNGKYLMASKNFQKIAKLNGVKIKLDELAVKDRFSKLSDHDVENKLSVLDQIKGFVGYRQLWSSNIIIWITLCIMHIAAKGMQFNLGIFVSSPYVLMITMGCVRLWQPVLFVFLDLKYRNFRRKIFLLVAIIITTVPFFLGMITGILSSHGVDSYRTNVATGFLLIIANSMNFGVLYYALGMIALELYPTSIRNIGFSSMAISGGLGSIIGPPIFGLNFGWDPLRYVLITAAFVICGTLCVIILPETKNKPLPDTVKHLEERNLSVKRF